MKKAVITSGSFTEAGNFSGYSEQVEGGRLFIHSKQMEVLGYNKDSKIEFPLYATVTTKEITPWDEDNKPMVDANGNAIVVSRTQAGSVFKTKQEFVQALAEPQLIDLEVAKLVKDASKSAGLTEKEMESLIASSVI